MRRVPRLETARLLMREWRDDDLDAVAAIAADAETVRFYFKGKPLDRRAAKAVLDRRRRVWHKNGFGYWALETKQTGELVGWAGIQPTEEHPDLMPAVEIGWLIARHHWGHGLATEAGARALDFGFGEAGLTRIVALSHPENRASQRVMEKLGMEQAGTSVDMRDGDRSVVSAITRERWFYLRGNARHATGDGRLEYLDRDRELE